MSSKYDLPTTFYNEMLKDAIIIGNIEICKYAKIFGADNVIDMYNLATTYNNSEIIKLIKEWHDLAL